MKKYYPCYLLTVLLVLTMSCKNSDTAPEVTETPIIIGNKQDLNVFNLDSQFELIATDEDSVYAEIDIDGDQLVDLTLSSYRIDEQAQLILIRSSDQYQVPFLTDPFVFSDFSFNYLSLIEEGVELEKDNLDWTSNQQLLMAYRSKNSFTMPFPSPFEAEAFLPLYDGKTLGWLTFNVSVNESNLDIESISLKEYIYTELD